MSDDIKQKEELARQILNLSDPVVANPISQEVLKKYGLSAPKNSQEIADMWRKGFVKLLVDTHTLEQLQEKLAAKLAKK